AGGAEVEGVLWAQDFFTLGTLFANFREYQLDGGAYTLVEPDGTVWELAILEMFRPMGRTYFEGGGGVVRRYHATFLIL
ncbi:hypothetical protein ACYOEI_15570, partial [Singulisphaera rosea]